MIVPEWKSYILAVVHKHEHRSIPQVHTEVGNTDLLPANGVTHGACKTITGSDRVSPFAPIGVCAVRLDYLGPVPRVRVCP